MKKILIILFIFYCSRHIYGQAIFFNNDFFANDKELIKIAKENSNNLYLLEKKINEYFLVKGYILNKVKDIIQDKENGYIGIFLTSGKIEDIKLIGDFKISKRIILIYLRYRKGDVFNKNKFELQLKKLSLTKLFEKITYTIIKKAGKNILIINLNQMKKRFLELNGNYNSQYGAMPFISYTERNLFNTLIDFNISADIGIWNKLNYQDYIFSLKRNIFSLDLNYRYGKKYIGDFYLREYKLNILPGINLLKSNSLLADIYFPINKISFYDYEKFKDYKIINSTKFGCKLLFRLNNERYIVDEKGLKELYFSGLIFYSTENSYYYKILLKTSYPIIYKYFTQFYFKTFIGITKKDAPLEMLFYLQEEEYQRAYYPGIFISNIEANISSEINFSIIYNFFDVSLFLDTTIYKNKNSYSTLLGYGPGVSIKYYGFEAKISYGIPFNDNFFNGVIHISLKKLFFR